jgi:hypothetical protein
VLVVVAGATGQMVEIAECRAVERLRSGLFLDGERPAEATFDATCGLRISSGATDGITVFTFVALSSSPFVFRCVPKGRGSPLRRVASFKGRRQ